MESGEGVRRRQQQRGAVHRGDDRALERRPLEVAARHHGPQGRPPARDQRGQLRRGGVAVGAGVALDGEAEGADVLGDLLRERGHTPEQVHRPARLEDALELLGGERVEAVGPGQKHRPPERGRGRGRRERVGEAVGTRDRVGPRRSSSSSLHRSSG